MDRKKAESLTSQAMRLIKASKALMTVTRHNHFANLAAEGDRNVAQKAARKWAEEVWKAMGSDRLSYEGPDLEGLLIHWPEQARDLALHGL